MKLIRSPCYVPVSVSVCISNSTQNFFRRLMDHLVASVCVVPSNFLGGL
jgi:hypothetical protein